MKFPAIFGLNVLLCACASYTADYEERLIRSLPMQRGATIEESKSFPGQVLCGQYNALDAGGYRFQTQRFVVTRNQVLKRPSEDQIAVYCSRDPQSALIARLGIRPASNDWSDLKKVRDDMRAITEEITAFYTAKLSLPNSLSELAAFSETLTEKHLIDPWGKAYFYEGGLGGRVAPRYTLFSYGADNAPGGDSRGTDIRSEQLPLLDHVLRLRES